MMTNGFGGPPRLGSDDFFNRLKLAGRWEAWVASALTDKGLYVVCFPTIKAKSKNEQLKYMHSQDLDVSSQWPDIGTHWPRLSVELKSVHQRFTSPDSYRFDDVYLCSQDSWVRKNTGESHTDVDFLKLSIPTGSILWIPKGSPVTLGHEVYDTKRGELFKVVKTPKLSLKSLDEFVEYVKQETGG